MHLYNSINSLEGFYRIGKIIDIGDTTVESVTVFDLDQIQYKHKGLLIDPVSTTTDAIVQFKFYDRSTADGKSSDYITLTIPFGNATPPYIIPCKVSTIRIQNGLAPSNTYKIRVALLN